MAKLNYIGEPLISTSIKLFFVFFLLLATTSTLFPQDEAKTRGLSAINKDVLEAQLEFLSSDLMEGRAIGERGLFLAGEYISSILKLYGIKPAGDMLSPGNSSERGYFQNFSLIRSESVEAPVLKIIDNGKEVSRTLSLNYNIDYTALPTSYSEEIEAPIIFVGYGIKDDKTEHNDFKGLDIGGKFLLKIKGYPGFFENRLTTTEIRHSISRSEQFMISEGALGIIEFDPEVQIVGNEVKADFLRTDFAEYPPSPNNGNARYSIPINSRTTNFIRATVSCGVAQEILKGSGINIENYLSNPSNYKQKNIVNRSWNKQLYFKSSVNSTRVETRNILGMVEGKDPNSIIVVGAHYDHMGMKDGYIWNGADDNGSGTVGVMTIAKAIMAAGEQPNKTIVFAFWSAEEVGLLGSRYFVRNTVCPLENIKMNINFDMISRYVDDDRPNVVTMTYNESYPIYKDYTELNNKRHNIGLEIDYQPSPNPLGGSDHRSFVEMGIPIMRFKPGHREEYHTPFDEITTIDWDIMEKIVRISFANLWDLANSDWDTEEYVKPPELDRLME